MVQNNTEVAIHSGKNTSFFVSKLTCDIFKKLALEVRKISIPSLHDEISPQIIGRKSTKQTMANTRNRSRQAQA